MAALAVSAQASTVTTFDVDFEEASGYTNNVCPAGAKTGGTWSGDTDSYVTTPDGYASQALQLDTGSSALTFTPDADGTSVIEMDIQFVGASTAQDPVSGSQFGLYLDKTTGYLQVSTNGAAFVATSISISESTWYHVTLTFDYSTKAISLSVTNSVAGGVAAVWTGSNAIASDKTQVGAVDFLGNGLVDNFVGKPAIAQSGIPMSGSTSSDDSDGSPTDTPATFDGGWLTPAFDATSAGNDLKFIKVTGTIGGQTVTRTLRVVGGNQSINVAGCGFTTIDKVVAYYGNSVTATDGATPTVSNVSVAGGEVSGTVAGKSGLYYSKVVGNTKYALNDNNPVAPEHEGDSIGYTVPASNTGYGFVKFKIVASDDPVPAP